MTARRAAALGLVATLLLSPTAGAYGGSRQTASLTFTTTRPATPSGSVFSADWQNPSDPGGKPYSVARLVIEDAPGTLIDTSAPEQCHASDAQLQVQGAAACPAGSRVAGGTIVSDAGGSVGPFPRFIDNKVDSFNNAGELIGVGEATNAPVIPGITRTVTRSKIVGSSISTDFPAVYTGSPPDGYAAFRSLRLTGSPIVRAGRTYLRTPPTCPARGYWINTLTFVYRDGVSQTVSSRSPCER